MFKYVHDPLSFRLSAWPWGGSSYITTYNYRTHNILFRPLLDYLAQELDKSPTVKVRKTTMTLVNVYSGFTDLAYGSGGTPHKAIRRGPLVFTFAMTRRDDFAGSLPRHVIWNTGMTCLWGPKLQYSHDYLTISVPIDICVQCRFPNTLRRQMEWLYKIVGGWSKSYARNQLTESQEHYPVKSIHDKIYYRTIPQAMWNYQWRDWKYVREFWDRAPDILNLDELSDTFFAYFLQYLTRYYKKVDDPVTNPAFRKIEQWTRSAVLDLVQHNDTPATRVLIDLIPTSVQVSISENQPTDVESIVQTLCNGGYR